MTKQEELRLVTAQIKNIEDELRILDYKDNAYCEALHRLREKEGDLLTATATQ